MQYREDQVTQGPLIQCCVPKNSMLEEYKTLQSLTLIFFFRNQDPK